MTAQQDPDLDHDWSALPAEAALTHFTSSPAGLGNAEAAVRLARYGKNRLPMAQRRKAFIRFLLQFHNILIYVLLAASVVTAFLGHWVDTSVILAVVVINAAIGFIQEGKAEEAMDAVRKMLSLQATVLRDGRRIVLPAEDIVPGDIVILQSGDKAPADLRLIRVKNLQLQEAALTGESVPVEKHAEPVPPGSLLGDRASMAYSSTLVTYGQGTGVVVATGMATEIGRISAMLSEVEELTTPLLRRMSEFGRWLTAAILILAALTFAFGFWVRHFPASEMFMVAVGLAVAAIPEGLPAIITVALAMGVRRMATRKAIIRRLPAVETLGSVTTICTDKTGTLTRNEMTVRSVATAAALYETSGVGYDPHGGFNRDGKEVSFEGEGVLIEALRGGMLCNDAVLHEKDGVWSIDGDPTEGALLTAAAKAGLDAPEETKQFPRTDEIPFESQHRFMATLHHDHAGNGLIFVKGAPERLLEMCRYERIGDAERPLVSSYWLRQIDEIAAKGQRVLALAVKRTGAEHRELTHGDVASDLTFLCLFGLIDPPREEAVTAIRECLAAGISVKMITGDHAATASAIARDLGLADPCRALTGGDLEQIGDKALQDAVLETNIFARASPEHKLRLVLALQSRDQIVAMTGDGVNDAPALKRADIGVAMGLKGTEAAKEASQIVLADDNFASIAHAVREGRAVYDNLLKTILFILPTNGGEAMTVIGALALGYVLPVTPVQILWVNLVTAVTLGIALAFEAPESDVMSRPPRSPKARIASRFFVWRVAFVSTLMMIATFGLFSWEIMRGADLEVAQTVAVNMLVACEMVYLFNARFKTAPSFTWQGFTGSRPVLIAVTLTIALQALFTYFPPMETLLGTRALDFEPWGKIAIVALALFVFIELEKATIRNWTAEVRLRESAKLEAMRGREAAVGLATQSIPPSRWGWRLPAATLVILAFAGGWFAWSQYPGRAIRYVTQKAERGPIVRTVAASGVITAVNTLPILAAASGVIEAVYCNVNVRVQARQVCAKIDPRPYQAAVDLETAGLQVTMTQLSKSKAALSRAKATFERSQLRARRGAVDRAALDRARSAYEQAQAQVALAEASVAECQAALRAAEIGLSGTDIVSPVEGIVIERNVEIGRWVTAGSEAQLFLIGTDLTRIRVETQVEEKDVGEIHLGDIATFTVALFPGRQFAGEVTQISETRRLTDTARTFDVLIAAPNANLLLEPGMIAAVTIVVDHRDDVLRAPSQALRYFPPGHPPPGSRVWPDESSQLWILREGRPEAVSVWLGLSDGIQTEIVRGDLHPGDDVIVDDVRGVSNRAVNH